jgi:hypothetical protein
MIAVVGRLDDGTTLAVARRVVRGGGGAQLVTTVPPGSVGDRHLAELAAAGVGHAAALRSPSERLDPADLDLALRYLPDLRVVVLAADAAALGATAADAAAWAGARLVAIAGRSIASATAGGAPGDGPSDDNTIGDAIVLAPPPSDPDEAFAGIVAALAVRLDRGDDPAAAWRAVERDLGLEGVALSRSGRLAPDPGPSRRR